MNLDELRQNLSRLSDVMDNSIEEVNIYATRTQERIYELLLQRLNELDTLQGNLNPNQPIAQKIAAIQREMNAIIGNIYTPRITDYLATYDIVEDTNIFLQQSYNELLIKKQLLIPARRAVYDQAEYFLTTALADAYVQPAKYLLLQAVTNGISLKDAKSLLRNWNDGELTSGKLTSGRPTPRLQAYSGQIASDSIFQYNGTIQNIIKEEYKLTKGIYVGGIISDSRPGCKYLVGLKRKIDIDEIPAVLIKYPQGTIPGTTKKTFSIYRMGYRCRHLWHWVKG